MPKKIEIGYYAILRQQAGRTEEILDTASANPAELYAELQTRYGFTVPPAMLKVAVNDEFATWGTPLADGDKVVFIAPVAGG
jgi:molybdopterin converting factor small subunit